MSEGSSGSEKVEGLWRKRLEDALYQLNLATLRRQEIQDLRACNITSPEGGYAFRQALRAESGARLTYLRVSKILEDMVSHSKIPSEDVPKVKKASR
jgi:hypothetical protein